jgi:hypothetical protein
MVVKITYGNAGDEKHDFIRMGESSVDIFTRAISGYLVDFVPFRECLLLNAPFESYLRELF